MWNVSIFGSVFVLVIVRWKMNPVLLLKKYADDRASSHGSYMSEFRMVKNPTEIK